jgi:hypothetical protein
VPVSTLIHASCQEDPIRHAENRVQDTLDELTSRGALQTENQMDIEHLLNPRIEIQTMEDMSDEEIYKAVMDAKRAQEDIEINGGDDSDTDIPVVEPRPTSQEVLKAASVIGRYIEESNATFVIIGT